MTDAIKTLSRQALKARAATFTVGEHVQAHPATDTWMRGDRWGYVIRITRTSVHVEMNMSGRTIRFSPDNLLHEGE